MSNSPQVDFEITDQIGRPNVWRGRLKLALFLLTAVAIIAVISVTLMLKTSPATYTTNGTFVVNKGEGIIEIATNLEQSGYVYSADLLYFALVVKGEDTLIQAGTYSMGEPKNLLKVAELLLQPPAPDSVVLTIPEGVTARMIADLAEQQLTDFDELAFLDKAAGSEGRLFPDTYHLPPDFSAEELYDLLTATFAKRISPLEDEIKSSDYSLTDLVIFASILEREANDPESMAMVAGVIANRLEIGMPLQVDAAFEYVLNRPGTTLTKADLAIDSPYNTYTNLGFPPTAIGNPGLVAIEAALNPRQHEYYYYITGNDGNFYYAKTLDEHNLNVARYLR